MRGESRWWRGGGGDGTEQDGTERDGTERDDTKQDRREATTMRSKEVVVIRETEQQCGKV